tara:strand:+ start:89 stop:688 length:600 start_codon:yes stop_codon:yes gene_type:complete
MSLYKNRSKFFISFFFVSLFLSCKNENVVTNTGKSLVNNTVSVENNTPLGQASVLDNVSDRDILKVAMASKDHSTLVTAVQSARIEHILSNAGPLTVFAPNNNAFEKLPDGTVQNLLNPENIELLATVLTRHAAPGSFDMIRLKKEAQKGRKLYMATGDYLDILVEGDDIFINGCKILTSIQTSNGIINVIDKVILISK